MEGKPAGVGIAMLMLAACGGGGSAAGGAGVSPPPPPPPPPPAARPFSDVTSASGIAFAVGMTPRPGNPTLVYDATSGGAASGDCDGDDDIDLFITAGDSGSGANRLYLNQLYINQQGAPGIPLRFVDTAASAGVAYTRSAALQQNDRHSGPTFADLDGDGDLDLFMGGVYEDRARIFENDGSCRFTDITSGSPELVAMKAHHTISSAFGDYDLDGDLDMFLTHWSTPDTVYTGQPVWATDHLWENRFNVSGSIEFVNVSVPSNVSAITYSTRTELDPFNNLQNSDRTFTPTFARIDTDLWPDIALAADFGTTQLLLNNGNSTFRDSGFGFLRDAHFGMGSALGDFDNDGDLDWFVSSIFGTDPVLTGNRFFRNDENGTGVFSMSDATEALGVEGGGWGWGSCFLDLDNDRDLDIYHANGWSIVFLGQSFRSDPTAVFVHEGTHYVNRAATLGLEDFTSSRGVVCADFDEDGDVDILQLSFQLPNSGTLWENRTAASGRNFLRVKLQGLAPNTEAAGARIYVTAGGVTQMHEVTIGSNYISQNPTMQHFGLGTAASVESVRVVWPARVPGPGQLPVQPADTVLPNGTQPVISVNGTLAITQAP